MMRYAIELDSADQYGYVPQVEKILAEYGYESGRVSSGDILAGALDYYDALIFPGGLGSFYGCRTFGARFVRAIQYYVASGISLAGFCGGAYAASLKIPPVFGFYSRLSLGLIDCKTETPPFLTLLSEYQRLQEAGERLTVICRAASISHPIIDGYQGQDVEIVYSGGPIITECGPSVIELMHFVDDIIPAYAGEAALVASQFGRGKVVLVSPHPEAPLEPGVDVNEPCLGWLYQRCIEYIAQPADTSFFPIAPWEKVEPMPYPILPAAGLTTILGLIIGGGVRK